MGVGGIMNGRQAMEKQNAGANLLQVYTGLVYGGPAFAADLCAYLVQNAKLLTSGEIQTSA